MDLARANGTESSTTRKGLDRRAHAGFSHIGNDAASCHVPTKTSPAHHLQDVAPAAPGNETVTPLMYRWGKLASQRMAGQSSQPNMTRIFQITPHA
jgi:hypothetical protein